MGWLWEEPENRWSRLGLAPGLHLRIEAERGGRVEQYATRVDDVTTEALRVLALVRGDSLARISPTTPVHVVYEHDDVRWHFSSWSLGRDREPGRHLVALPAVVEPFERRRCFRLLTFLRPVAVLRLDAAPARARQPGGLFLDAVVVDLGVGGVCLSSGSPAARGERLGLHLRLDSDVRAHLRVVAVEPPPPGQHRWRLHCAFERMHPGDEERLAHYLARRQTEMRQRGQL
ncbi:MAG: PilZ domain-containing protein [Dehalococcoidia bacterium]|nr:PilZ domain-containing protein [Dehalococcoidia bacterium]